MNTCDEAANTGECLVSDFAVILGLWSSYVREGGVYSGHAVDCKIQRGSVQIRQNGTGTPVMAPESFVKAATRLGPSSPEWYWQVSYRSPRMRSGNMKSYVFESEQGTVRDNPMAEYLLSNNVTMREGLSNWESASQDTNDTQKVARAIETSMDTATLFAFARAPHAAPLDITETHDISIWTYDTRVLAVLVLPFLATILILSIHWRIQSNEVVIGYDPLGTARRADEVLGFSLGATAQDSEGKNLRPTCSGGAYSALEDQSNSRGVEDRASLVDNVAETRSRRRSRSTNTNGQSDMAMVTLANRDGYPSSENLPTRYQHATSDSERHDQGNPHSSVAPR